MKLTTVIPAFNEANTITDVIQGILKQKIPEVDQIDVLVVDDGSTDETARLASESGAKVISNGTNRGLGFTFARGLTEAIHDGADIVVNIDGDGQFNPDDIPKLITPVLRGEADFVTASRFADPELIPNMPRTKLWGNRLMSRIMSTLLRQKFYDVSCGFRAYSREAALRLNLWGRFTYTQEVFLDLAVKQMRIKELPVKVLGVRPVGESRIARSLGRYAMQTAAIIFRSYRDYWPLRFFGWISLPFLLIGLLLLGFFGLHYVRTGTFSPHLWAGFTAAAFLFVGIFTLAVGFMADMLKRIRLNQEEFIFRQRLDTFGSGNTENRFGAPDAKPNQERTEYSP